MVTGEEVAGFRNGEYWGEDTDLFFDDDLVFFKTPGLNPVSAMSNQYGKISDDIKKNATLVGEGLIMGGLFVVNRDAVVYQHKEKDFGTVAPIAEVLEAVDDAVKTAKK